MRAVEIASACHDLWSGGLVTAHQGNVSCRYPGGYLVTPTGVAKNRLRASRVMFVPADMEDATPGVSSEWPTHLAAYHARPDVGAVVHAHPPLTTALDLAGHWLDTRLMFDTHGLLDPIERIRETDPGSPELADAVGDCASRCNVIILAGHGAVTLGETVERAMCRMQTLEHLSRVTLAYLTSMPRTPRTPSP